MADRALLAGYPRMQPSNKGLVSFLKYLRQRHFEVRIRVSGGNLPHCAISVIVSADLLQQMSPQATKS